MNNKKSIKPICINCMLFLLSSFGTISSQVTIGSELKPNEGALLDLKEEPGTGANSTKGLALPRVQLSSISSLDDIETGLDKKAHIGLTIYVPEEFLEYCPGIYIWNGESWDGLNADTSRAPEYITETDIDGNVYTAKIFQRKGCKGGTYWFTSNLRTTRFNDGTPVASIKDDKIPMLMTDGKTNTWEVKPYDPVTKSYYLDENNTKLHLVRSKADISTSGDADKIISFYENGVLQKLTEDEYATKFGLLYAYYMAYEGDYKQPATVKDRNLLCPKGWKLPTIWDWIYVAGSMVTPENPAASTSEAQWNGAEYVGSTSYIKPIDEDIIFAPENVGIDGYAHFESVNPNGGESKASWFIRKPIALSKSLVKNTGLNVYPTGYANFLSTSEWVAEYRGFGTYAFFLDSRYATVSYKSYKVLYYGDPIQETAEMQLGYGAGGDQAYASVRCIKVVK